jgi:nucleoside phosphorylase
MPQVIGLTLESVSACRKEAAFWRRAYPNAALETQENAAYLRFGARLGLPVYALRVISNWVGDRRWDRLAAFEALANFAYHVGFPLYERLLAGEAASGSGH